LEIDTERIKEDLLLRVNIELATGIVMLDTNRMTIYQIADRFYKVDTIQRDIAKRISRRLDRATTKQGQGNTNSRSNSGPATGKEGSAPRLLTTPNNPLPGGLSSYCLPYTENPNPEKEHYIKLRLYYHCGK
jgi:hypothetical protein